ncbi:MAG: hypothetical protein NWE91_04695 [Candidatus Bathyarchaeota archaeon]|nr:hypothetical protein [Candidatus Bathyarchaeota archaeon]
MLYTSQEKELLVDAARIMGVDLSVEKAKRFRIHEHRSIMQEGN